MLALDGAAVPSEAACLHALTPLAGSGAPTSSADVAAARRLFARATAAHGAHSAGLWMAWRGMERAVAAAGMGGGRDEASEVYAKGMRALREEARAEFVASL